MTQSEIVLNSFVAISNPNFPILHIVNCHRAPQATAASNNMPGKLGKLRERNDNENFIIVRLGQQ